MEGFKDQSITAVVRSGDRVTPQDFKFIPEGVDVPVRFIKRVGNAAQKVEAELYPDDGTTVRRTFAIVKPIRELTLDDLSGVALDQETPELVRYHLGMVDNVPRPDMNDLVTIWHFEYQPDATE